MSFQHTLALQAAIFDILSNDLGLGSLAGGAVYDEVPAGELPDTYILIGEEKALDRSDYTSTSTRHDITISVISNQSGFLIAKACASRICDLLVGQSWVLSSGNMRSFRLVTAKARRSTGAANRRIDLIFKAFIDET
ncbi:hypothetical protein GCM10007939_03380 [Amylibacter marinus]|uniref:DUF3168 domain-containing protein n=1 Tax=Amylibacter marinus TaxID=1475483 RepID=A0ABQ5VRM6_9RHOB|nr:DUF3168 domain-containing protein [Amylibacter marinus]GLQ34055.1 hypothetical protein GCM10007939_03380 [Amylibacter marinus]